MTPEHRKIHDAILADWAKRGQIIAGGFAAMRELIISRDAPQIQVDEMRIAYFAGAQHLWASMMSVLSPDADPTPEDLRRMQTISDELIAFGKQLELMVAKTSQQPS